MRDVLVFAALALPLVACGGGGGDDATDAPTTTDGARADAGVLADAPPTDAMRPRVVVNEVFAAGDPAHPTYATDWVELANVSDAAVDVGGWHLSDSIDDYTRGTFPTPTTVPAHGWLRIDLGAAPYEFSLKGDGTERLLFVAPDGVTVLEDVQWPPDAAGTLKTSSSWARLPDGTGAFSASATATPGAANAP